ncbi:MAG: hypothetical protein MJ125_06600, partial [Clostridia bacterium]|nr:hypothetical protein [Clostridia bacterium]
LPLGRVPASATGGGAPPSIRYLLRVPLDYFEEEHTKLNNVSFEVGIYLTIDVCLLFEIKMYGIRP